MNTEAKYTLAALAASACLISTASPAYAQAPSPAEAMSYIKDAYTWAQNDYYGSARTLAMGNAFTALGGDLGSIEINPAGGAVASYAQFSITPGVSVSINNAAGRPTCDGNTYMGSNVESKRTRFIFPNGGFTFAFNTGNITGLKRFTIGFVSNCTQIYNDKLNARGTSDRSSYAGYMSWSTSRLGADQKITDVQQQLASNADIICHSDMMKQGADMGITEWPNSENSASVAGNLNQRYSKTVTGYKNDFIFNIGFDFSDIVFVGANLGITTQKYEISEILNETAAPGMSDFPTGFSNLAKSYSYANNGTGIYGKFGIIITPVGGLRIGAAIQTPTMMNLSESYSTQMSNSYKNSTRHANDFVNDVKFSVVNPWRFNAGIAYAFKKAVISADYEMVNYKNTRYRAKYASDEMFFDYINGYIRGDGVLGDFGHLTLSHIARVGVEFKPIDILPIRAGYNFSTCGAEFNGEGRPNLQSFSFGIGYDSPGSFFCDLAARYNLRETQTIKVYSDYDECRVFDKDGEPVFSNPVGGPIVESKRGLLSIVATIGWRF